MSGPVRLLWTIRHSETAHNAEQRITGRLDEPLSEAGRSLAREALLSLGGPLSAHVVVASPMSRAIETAMILTGCTRSEIETDERCLERDYGDLQGLDRAQVEAFSDRVEYIEVGGVLHSINPPNGEPFEHVRERAQDFLVALRSRPEQSVILVSHQVFLQQLHGSLLDLDVYQCLGLDVATLQTDRFDMVVGTGKLIDYQQVFPGMRRFQSW